MERNPVTPALKQMLELGPAFAFFGIYLFVRDQEIEIFGRTYQGFIIAAAAFLPILLTSTAILWRLTGHLSKLQIFTAISVIFFTSLTIFFNDERFFQFKTTLVYGCFSAILIFGLLKGRSYLAMILSDYMPMAEEGWMIFTRRLAAAFAALAISNEITWRFFSKDTWVWVETFVFPAALFIFLASQVFLLREHIDEDALEAKNPKKIEGEPQKPDQSE